MTDKPLAMHFKAYCHQIYGADWETTLPKTQLDEVKQAFFMGALNYQAMMLKVMGEPGELTEQEAADGERVYMMLMEEIEEYGAQRMMELFGGVYGTGKV